MEINETNIGSLSFYNLVQLCRMTGYANPIGAFKANHIKVNVTLDDCGNIVLPVSNLALIVIHLDT